MRDHHALATITTEMHGYKRLWEQSEVRVKELEKRLTEKP